MLWSERRIIRLLLSSLWRGRWRRHGRRHAAGLYRRQRPRHGWRAATPGRRCRGHRAAATAPTGRYSDPRLTASWPPRAPDQGLAPTSTLIDERPIGARCTAGIAAPETQMQPLCRLRVHSPNCRACTAEHVNTCRPSTRVEGGARAGPGASVDLGASMGSLSSKRRPWLHRMCGLWAVGRPPTRLQRRSGFAVTT